MLKALVLKELRETAWVAALGLVAHLAFVASCAGYAVVPLWPARVSEEIPFLGSTFMSPFCFVSVALAAALGLRQTALESRGTWLFLLHRPASLRQVIAAKLAVGAGLYLICGLVAILTYAAWAATPGHHASPFFWWMTADAWEALGVIILVYFAAFLAGIRAARWLGTRLLPLAAAGPLAIAVVFVWLYWWLPAMAVLILAIAWLLGLILLTARTRDFS